MGREKDLFAAGSSDGVIKIWERCELYDTKDSDECFQTINLGSKYPIDLAISYLPESIVLILACGKGDLLLASGSQGKYIRIWKIGLVKYDQEEVDKGKGNENGNEKKSSIKDLLVNVLDDGTFTKAHIIDVEVAKDRESCVNKRYSIMFEALLIGHDD
ncbi:hypothetical protein C1646_753914 [Rhizophagus diaphanus]|nr:hypothetical protein C1646_753914 [Rhizophagus diaphanus] [Rhizophagus sp. MUCL 43196]